MGRETVAKLVAVCATGILMAACDANFYAQHRTDQLDKGITVLTGAETRAIVNFKADLRQEGRNNPSRLICAEPSPDVAQAISFAARMAGSVDQSKSPVGAPTSGLSVAGQFAIAGASAFAQLGERLAVIQLLRDKMYRACEAYANGAINSTSYTLMLARLDKTMTTLLTAEMAAGAFGRGLASAGGSASAGGNVDPKELQDARDEVKAAGEALKKAHGADPKVQADVDAANKRFDTAVAALAKIELKASQAAATAGGQNSALGQIAKANNGSPAVVGLIHQNHVDDDGLEPLTDACLQAFAGIKFSESTATAAANAQAANQKVSILKMSPVERSRAPETKEADDAQRLFESKLLQEAGLFPYFCAREILGGDGQRNYVQQRIDAKLKLREASTNAAAMTMCGGAVAAIAAKVENPGLADLVKACSDIARKAAGAAPAQGGGGGGARPPAQAPTPAAPSAPFRI